jgi:L-ascorbate metabolism protein UlaG (beta-lactamase superfamily)
MRSVLLSILLCLVAYGAIAQPDEIKTSNGILKITPVQHASFVMEWNGNTIYVDPAGGSKLYSGFPNPTMILITDIHGDHMDRKTLDTIRYAEAIMVMPPAVSDSLKGYGGRKRVVLKNGQETMENGISIRAVPMYNLPEKSDSRHPKGRGNGYLLNIGGKTIYISGDTEDIKEMRSLSGVDIAFVCMNVPYTMHVAQAVEAVADFQPKVVYPYHHRGQDINEFKKLLDKEGRNIEVRLREWYPNGE